MNVKFFLKFSLILILVLSIAACSTGQTEPGQRGTGQRSQGGNPIVLLDIASEVTGLEVETIREQSADGATLAEIITANGGDVEAVKAQMIEVVGDMPGLPGDGDVGQFVDNMLNNPLGQRVSGKKSP